MEINYKHTKYPVCPYCGEVQENYEIFLLRPISIICCKQDIHKQYKIQSHTDGTYTTYKED